MTSTYTDAITWTIEALVMLAGALTVLLPLLVLALALQHPARRARWRIDAHRN